MASDGVAPELSIVYFALPLSSQADQIIEAAVILIRQPIPTSGGEVCVGSVWVRGGGCRGGDRQVHPFWTRGRMRGVGRWAMASVQQPGWEVSGEKGVCWINSCVQTAKRVVDEGGG